MVVILAALVIAAAVATTSTADEANAQPAQSPPIRWSSDDVGRWAADSANGASLIQTERRALGANLQSKSDRQRAQIGLMQAVLHDLALHEQNDAAAEALKAYYQIVGLTEQHELLDEAESTLDTLIELALKAEQLELADGDASELRRERLGVRDQRVQTNYGIKKLRRQLSRLVGRDADDANDAVLIDALPNGTIASTDDALATAFANRSDLRAAETLCRCLTEESLPAARAMLGTFRPGLGLAAAAGTHGPLLAGLQRDDLRSELACRRRQCAVLKQSIRDLIADEVAVAVYSLSEASERLQLAEMKAALGTIEETDAETQVELDRLTPGSEQLARLETLRLLGELIQRRVDLAIAESTLRQAQGTLAQRYGR